MNLPVVSPHQDDETLSAGGAVKGMESQAYWLNVTNMKCEYGYLSERAMKEIRR